MLVRMTEGTVSLWSAVLSAIPICRDGKCQESCKVEACEWDFEDCDASQTVPLLFWPICSAMCLVITKLVALIMAFVWVYNLMCLPSVI